MKVIVRVRPLSNKQDGQIENYESYLLGGRRNSQKKLSHQIISFYSKYRNANVRETINVQQNILSIYDPQYKNSQKKMKDFTYSQVYGFDVRNETIFQKSISQGINGLVDGYNCTIMAYGITGSGKTYTIFGHPKSSKDRGLAFLAYQYLLKKKEELQISNCQVYLKFSFLQIYNENMRDLLANDHKQQITMGEDTKGNTQLVDVQQIEIKSIKQIKQLVSFGSTRRASAATISNQISSRSHAILKMSIEIKKQQQKITSNLFIIDLAGSQKIDSQSLLRKTQGININKSLLTLGNCINGLAQNSKKPGISHIPYRDSKLTRLLKDSLGGNTKTIMVACISTNPFTIQQTMTTLNYAERVQAIKKDVHKNITISSIQSILYSKCQCNMPQKVRQKRLFQHRFPEIEAISTEFLLRLYNDIVQNARQMYKLQRLRSIMHQQCQELDTVFKSNQVQKILLKNTLINLFKDKNSQKPKSSLLHHNKSSKKVIRLSAPKQNSKYKDKSDQIDKENTAKYQQIKQRAQLGLQEEGNSINSFTPSTQLKISILNGNNLMKQLTTGQRRKRSKVQIIKKVCLSKKRTLTEYQNNIGQ